MADVITLSDSDEESPSKSLKRNNPSDSAISAKKRKLDIAAATTTPPAESVVILSDEEEIQCEILETPDKETKASRRLMSGELIEIKEDKQSTARNQENNNFTVVNTGKENISENVEFAPALTNGNHVEEPPAGENGDTAMNYSLLHFFLDTCEKSLRNNSNHELVTSKFGQLWKHYKRHEPQLKSLPYFEKLLKEETTKAATSPIIAAKSVSTVYRYLKDLSRGEAIEVESKSEFIKLKKLEKCINALLNKIQELENAEIEFDDEEDSSYLQLDRYQHRLNKVYASYCKLLKRDPKQGRLTHNKIVFTDSNYPEVNIAIGKKYKNNESFPCYEEVEKLIRKVVQENGMKLGDGEIKVESSHCFRKLGDVLQRRRKRELYHTLVPYIEETEDPAVNDPNLNATLKESHAEMMKKLDKIYDEYANKVELDKDESNHDESDNKKSNDEQLSD